ncbi:MAG TPA: hypothetical protein VLB85_09305 [Acidimicrobiia bacterium]|nr:hypothetical protein [Acidimicrobiia bacterium]
MPRLKAATRRPALLSLLVVGALFLLVTPASAQENATVTIEATVGLGGFSSASQPGEVSATISSPVLVSGRLRVRGADITVSRPVEVPAGGSQIYRLAIPPLEDATRLRVELVDSDGDVIADEAVTIRTTSRDVLAVGVIGDEGLIDTLGRVRTLVTDRPVTPIEVPSDSTTNSWQVLDYLIVGPGADDRIADALEWAAEGGRLVVDAAAAPELVAGASPTGVAGVARAGSGPGEVVLVDSLAGRPGDDWSRILRPTPVDFSHSPEFGFGDQRALLTAASEFGTRQVPSLPWLLFAILGFAAVVGPLNFIILSRMGKRDLAWVTIPALSVLAVVGFWIAGRQRIVGTNLSHASVVVDEGAPRVRSAVLVAAGVEGERRLEFEDGALVFPERSLFGSGGTELALDGDRAARVNLDQLGFTGIGLAAPAPSAGFPEVRLEDGNLVVENTSSLSFWGWGAISGGAASVADSELGKGAGGRVALAAGNFGGEFGFSFIDALINQRQLWDDPTRSNSLWSLSQVLVEEIDADGVYFVGITDDYRPRVTLNGAPDEVPGRSMFLVKVGVVEGEPAADGIAEATVVGTGFVSWVDWGPQRVISTDELTVRFQLPAPGVEAALVNDSRFGVIPAGYEVWDWQEEKFTEYQVSETLPSAAVSADGTVFVKLLGGNEFGDNPMSPADLRLEWET